MGDKNFEIQYLEWDSFHFGFKVGKVVLTNLPLGDTFIPYLKSEAEKLGYKLLYIFLPGEIFIDSDEVKLVDRKILYHKEIRNLIPYSNFNNDGISLYREKIINDDLLNLTYESGKYSRFYLDKNFGQELFNLLYSKWIKRSVSGEIADGVLISEKDSHIIGMLTYKKNNHSIDIGLIAIDTKHQGQGLGSKLIINLEKLAKNENCSQITVATQKQNLTACSFYEKNKFEIKEITNIYHFWL